MSKDVQKVAKRSAKRVARLANKSIKRLDDLMAGPITGDKLADALTKGWADAADAALSFFSVGDAVPRAYVDIVRPPGGTGSTQLAVNDSVSLDDAVAFGLLVATPLISPGTTTSITPTLTAIDGTTPPSTQQMEDVKVNVSVPDNQAAGLYHGFIASGSTVLAEVYANVH